MTVPILAVVAACHKDTGHRAPPATRPPPAEPAKPVAGVTPVEGDVILPDFAFASGEHLPELRIHYLTLGKHDGDNAVLVLHGTTGSGRQFLQPQFADELFGPGQPLDLQKYFVILPDDIGHGQSSKPSDGLHAKFPQYGYADMVEAEHALVAKLGVDHLRLLMGTSMGCMHSWMWAERWPDAMDAVMPLACLPTAIAGRNRMWRDMVIEGIRGDPDWKGGEYTEQPRRALVLASDLLTIAGSVPLLWQQQFATPDAADAEVAKRTQQFLETHDANDVLYAVASSRDYDPSADLGKITAPVVFVNSRDDFINPPELGLAEELIKQVKRGTFVLIDGGHGHGSHTWATLWKDRLVDLLARTAR